MDAHIYYNKDAKFMGYDHSDRIRHVTSVEVDATDDIGALERVFAGLNRGSGREFLSPAISDILLNYLEERSLSVGDVVLLGTGRWYACEDAGWKRISPPIVV